MFRALENRFIFFPPRYPEGFPPAEAHPIGLEEAWLVAEDGVRLNAWFLPHQSSSKVLLWLHGNATNIGYELEPLKTFSLLGLNILALDYRGYGKSEGRPDEHGVYRDGEAAFHYLVEGRTFNPRDIFIYGHSLGGAVAIDLATRHDCGGLIVESSFTSVPEMARWLYPIPFIEYVPPSKFDSLAKIARVHTPVLIIHGRRDQVVPISMGERLFQAAPQPKWFIAVEGAEHDSLYVAGGEKYWQEWNTFLRGSAQPGD